ncbi:uncharacterized protein PAC_04212 [Phialocephala subalpina]|uniref:DUR3-Urea permease n=1 Tax=Phialocephala subalpina TaxID=576137 RepID=A0A1L7WNI0_9HELO|nr:uncharacterized protein PAC_04212 [Phialocephala subalpina]
MSTNTIAPVLPEGAGYGVVVGIGFFFAFLMAGISYIQNRYIKYSTRGSEEFNTASRSVKSGLIAAGIVSAWTWAATPLQSSTVAYEYGISGPFWIFMFAVLAWKQNAPRCHTLKLFRSDTQANFSLGGAVVTALTGRNVYAAIFLIQLGVYVVLGGLRATFLCSSMPQNLPYFLTTIRRLHQHLHRDDNYPLLHVLSLHLQRPYRFPNRDVQSLAEASVKRPVAGNQDGSPTTAVRAYILGEMAWFAIPFGFATTLGLAAVALTDNPAYSTYPNNMTSSQISSGLSAPFAVIAHIMICVFGLSMAAFACIWNAIGIDLGWLFLVMGLLIGGAVFPAAFAVTWKKRSKYGAVLGAVGGLCAGLIAWLVEAKVYYGELTVASTGGSYPTLAGNMAGVLTGLILTAVVSILANESDLDQTPAEGSDFEKKSNSTRNNPILLTLTQTSAILPTTQHEDAEALEDKTIMEDPTRLKGGFRFACISATVLTLLMGFIIPIPMFLTHYIFSKGFFIGWVMTSFI